MNIFKSLIDRLKPNKGSHAIDWDKIQVNYDYDKVLSIVQWAIQNEYNITKVDGKIGLIKMSRYSKSEFRESFNYYITTGTITTEINHPKKGKTQLHRKGLSVDQIKKVISQPRTHTGKGYYNK